MCTSVTRYIGITLLSSVPQAKPRGTKRLGDENTLLLINSYEEPARAKMAHAGIRTVV